MIIDMGLAFEQAVRALLPHRGHKLSVVGPTEGSEAEPLIVACDDCRDLLIEFLPSASWRYLPDQVRYEGHYDEALDLCYVEVFKPGKSPYPLQERQDIVNHSPTGVAWGYGGSGPAQCAFALLMDYLRDEEQVRLLYQDFKFHVAKFSPNSPWILTGHQIENAISRIARHAKHS